MSRWFVCVMSGLHRTLYRVSRGRVGGKMQGVPILLLTTTGRKTGKKRTTPLMYTRDGDRLVLIASYGGAPQNPAWWTNLEHDPRAEVNIRGEHLTVRARAAADGDERKRLWQAMAALYPTYDDYQKKTERRIPVVVLEPQP
jgi:deazaflavin-dependent oxidoreductase (nitroreductase family)